MASSGAAVVAVLLVIVVLLGTGSPVSATAPVKPTACKDCNSTCASSISSSSSPCGGVCGAPVQECVAKCISNGIVQCTEGCTLSTGNRDSCSSFCNGSGSLTVFQSGCKPQCCPSPQRCQEITNGVMQMCLASCAGSCKESCGHD